MSTDQIEIQARASAVNVGDSLSRAALVAQLADAIALLTGINTGLNLNLPDGQQVTSAAEASISCALGGVETLIETLTAGIVYEPADADIDLEPHVEPPHVWLPVAVLEQKTAEAWEDGWRAGMVNARVQQNVLVTA